MWTPSVEERQDAVLYASNVPLGATKIHLPRSSGPKMAFPFEVPLKPAVFPVVLWLSRQNFMALELGVPVTNTSNKIVRKVGGPFDLSDAVAGGETPGHQPLLADSSPD